MPSVKRVILVTAKHLPQHLYFEKIARDLSSKLGVNLEVKEEDYEFLSNYGEKDEFGMAWAPQLFVELEDGSVKVVLSKLPIDTQTLKIDVDKARREVEEKLKELGVSI